MSEQNRAGEGFMSRDDISDDAKAHLFGTIEVDYDNKCGVFEVDANKDPDAVIVTVGPNTDLSDPDKLVTEIDGRPVMYDRAEDMPELLVFPEGE